MTTLVVGASGETGRLLVEQLLARGEIVKVIVRSVDRLPKSLVQNDRLSITEADLLDVTPAELNMHVKGCRAVVSCLGHNLTIKGVYGHPRWLVVEAVERLCQAITRSSPKVPVKFILMNTTGNQNKMAGEVVSFAQSLIMGVIRCLIPPHYDNELAAGYLMQHCGEGQKHVEWVAVRPDTLVNELNVSAYNIYPSPIRSAIFDSGKTSRVNVAHFMVNLIFDERAWVQWQGKMPVIYNALA